MAIGDRLGNPIVMREGITRARSLSTPITMTLYLCLVGGFAMAMFSRAISGAPNRLPAAEDMANAVFLTVAFQLVLALLFVPPLAAGGIAGERERGTLDMLVLGRMSPSELAWGKLVAAVAYPLTLILAAFPLLTAAFLYAGLDLGQLLIVEVLTIVTAVTLGAVATLLSTVSPSTVVATVTAYGAALGLYVVTALVGAVPTLEGDGAGWGAHPLLFANPFYALKAVTTAFAPAGAATGELLQRLAFRGGRPSTWGPVVQPWQVSVVIQLIATALSMVVTGRLLSGRRLRRRPPAPAPAVEREAAGANEMAAVS